MQQTYFIRNVDSNAIKIGKAVDVKERLSSLQTGSSSKLVLLLVLADDRETELHDRFAKARLGGEWFNGNDAELNKFIVQNLHAASTIIPERRRETFVFGIYRSR